MVGGSGAMGDFEAVDSVVYAEREPRRDRKRRGESM